MSTDVTVTQAEAWECFQDSSYYDMWCVRQVGDRTFGSGFHLMRGEEATALRDLLNQRADAQAVAALVEALKRIRDRKWNTMTQGCDAAAEAASIARAALGGEHDK